MNILVIIVFSIALLLKIFSIVIPLVGGTIKKLVALYTKNE